MDLGPTWGGWILMVGWAVCWQAGFTQPQISLEVLVPVWGGWMEKTGMGCNGGAAEPCREQSCALVPCGHLLPAAGCQGHPGVTLCGVFGWLPTAFLLPVGEPQLWHRSRQSIPSPLPVPPGLSGASQTNCLMSGPVLSNA